MSMSGPRQIRLRYLRDAQILSFVSCIVLSHSLISAEMEYHGFFPPEEFSRRESLLLPLQISLALAAAATMGVLAFRIVRRPSNEAVTAIIHRIVGISVIAVCYISAIREPPRHETLIRGMRHWVLGNADLSGMATWLHTVDDEDADKVLLPDSDLPPVIADLSPRMVYFTRTKDDDKIVTLVWGGGFGHYGLCVAEWEVRLPPPSAGDLSLPIGHNARVWVETQ